MNFTPPIDRHRGYLAKAAEVFMTTTIDIVRPVTPTYDPVTGRATAGSDVDHQGYTGKAQLSRSSSAGQVLSGESYQEISTVSVQIPMTAEPIPRVEDLVVVLSCPEDPLMQEEVLRIIDVTYGGIAASSRTLVCTFATATPFNPDS